MCGRAACWAEDLTGRRLRSAITNEKWKEHGLNSEVFVALSVRLSPHWFRHGAGTVIVPVGP
jgi:hypothetical protein